MMNIKEFRQTVGAKWSTFILLLPLAIFGSIYFGINAFYVLLLSTLSTMLAGAIIQWSNGGVVKIFNPGSMITGLLMGLTLSPLTPFYMIITGGFVAEYIGKQALPALSKGKVGNIFNPAVLGRAVIAVLENFDPVPYADLASGASLLFKEAGGMLQPYYWDAFFGFTKGSIGETSTLLLLIVGFLMLRYVVIKREAAITMLLTVPVMVFILPDTPEIVGHAPWMSEPLVYLMGGPTLLMAFFFVTAPETSPNTIKGGIIFGMGVAVLSVLGKMYTSIAGIEMYAILIMNLMIPLLNSKRFRYAG
ncbi:MAG: RnfABCDGE type electron transport complex subunit D [Gammaproteobacteria bacterium]|nr:RnfABCDGE type electron transport complex subunit D [Gammaproteobacteria bacterium]